MDTLIRSILNEEAVVYACDITKIANIAQKQNDSWPAATVALGRTLAGTVLMCAMLKNKKDKITININGGGPAGSILAVGNALMQVKGYISNPYVNVEPTGDGNIHVSKIVGKNGLLTVIRDMGLKEPYIGMIKIETGEIAEDLAYYLLKSEQQPSIVYLNTWIEQDLSVLKAGGIIITPLPGCSEKTLSVIETKINDIKNYALYLLQKTPKQIVSDLFAEVNIKILDENYPVYKCDCSRNRIIKTLITLGIDELDDMIRKDKGTEITCRFCNKKYRFSEQELNIIIKNMTEKQNV